MKYFLICICIILFLIFILKIFGIKIIMSKFENKAKIRVVNNSYLDTFKNFIDKNDYEYLVGKVIFFNTWASWCSSCIKEIPILNKIHSLNKTNNNIAFASYCNDLENTALPDFLKKKKLELNFKFLKSKEGLRSSIRTLIFSNTSLIITDPSIDSIPMNCIIDKDEKILFYKNGSLNENDFIKICEILKRV